MTDPLREALEPCPFCGNADPGVADTGSCWVRCLASGCGCEGPIRDSENDAIKSWNDRAVLAQSRPGSGGADDELGLFDLGQSFLEEYERAVKDGCLPKFTCCESPVEVLWHLINERDEAAILSPPPAAAGRDAACPKACPKCQNTGWCHGNKVCDLSGYPLTPQDGDANLCPCGVGDEPCPGPDGKPACATPSPVDRAAVIEECAKVADLTLVTISPDGNVVCIDWAEVEKQAQMRDPFLMPLAKALLAVRDRTAQTMHR